MIVIFVLSILAELYGRMCIKLSELRGQCIKTESVHMYALEQIVESWAFWIDRIVAQVESVVNEASPTTIKYKLLFSVNRNRILQPIFIGTSLKANHVLRTKTSRSLFPKHRLISKHLYVILHPWRFLRILLISYGPRIHISKGNSLKLLKFY